MAGIDLIGLLVFLVIAALIYYCVTLLPLPAPFPVIIQVIVILAIVYWLATHFLGM